MRSHGTHYNTEKKEVPLFLRSSIAIIGFKYQHFTREYGEKLWQRKLRGCVKRCRIYLTANEMASGVVKLFAG
jgi:hypothetical protein